MSAIVGVILPPARRPPPEELAALYPQGVHFLEEWLGLEQMTPAGYEGVIGKIVPAAERLAASGARAIGILGTSLTFYKGAAFNEELIAAVTQATGLPATTMSTALVDGLRAFGAERVAVATAYSEEVNHLLREFFEQSGIQVTHLAGLGFDRIGMAGRVSPQDLFDFSARVWQESPPADALVVSCGGLRTLELIAPLEEHCQAPVVSSMPHAVWAAVRLLGPRPRSGYGRLIAQE